MSSFEYKTFNFSCFISLSFEFYLPKVVKESRRKEETEKKEERKKALYLYINTSCITGLSLMVIVCNRLNKSLLSVLSYLAFILLSDVDICCSCPSLIYKLSRTTNGSFILKGCLKKIAVHPLDTIFVLKVFFNWIT